MINSDLLCWILDIFDDLKEFASSNNLPITAQEIERLREISRWEIYSKEPTPPCNLLLIDTHGYNSAKKEYEKF